MSDDPLTGMMDAVRSFCDERDWGRFHTLKDLAIGISTEAGELLDNFRFKDDAECGRMLASDDGRERISDEMADVLFFLLRFSDVSGIDLVGSLEGKMRKNAEKYPVELSKGSNRKYFELT